MQLRRLSGALICAVSLPTLALGLAACGGGDSGGGASASDAATGLTVTVSNDEVKLKRSAKSTSGTAGTSGTVSCTDDYGKLAKANAVPAPSTTWYATTLIDWPAANKETTAHLSHKLSGAPQLCIAQTADSSASAVVYFSPKVKAAVTELQTDSSRRQQAAQATAALQAGARAAVSTVSQKAFASADDLVSAVTAQGIYTKKAASLSDVTETGTVYVVADQTTKTTATLAMMDTKKVVHTATQGVSGNPKIKTVK
ncbi:MAG TPA: hypothetical protein VFG42_13525 [Baekduia sp.]|uniref:hypothetical protein n=1 Tax=Baekduia sp. TaxID=2600305 RepID=UPI002D799764|nr:hypothetical protein [Baekduia sp.]HET6507804.1 hypothetical protein [Baekduia sp.]